MIWEVRWKRSAESALAHDWLAADSEARKAITRASHQIDYELQFEPDSKGESRDKGRRILHIAPLGVIFRVDHGNHRVFVLHAWHFR